MDYTADANSGFKAVVKKTPEIEVTPLVAPAVIPITPPNEIKGTIESNLFPNVLHLSAPLTTNHVHEETATVVHYSLPPFRKFILVNKNLI